MFFLKRHSRNFDRREVARPSLDGCLRCRNNCSGATMYAGNAPRNAIHTFQTIGVDMKCSLQQVFLALCIVASACPVISADDGYNLWMSYRQLDDEMMLKEYGSGRFWKAVSTRTYTCTFRRNWPHRKRTPSFGGRLVCAISRNSAKCPYLNITEYSNLCCI
jgi:hypothetical protein